MSVKQSNFMGNVAKLVLKIYSTEGYTCSGGELFRTPEQAALNEAKKIGIRNSQHCKRLAIDLNLFKDGVLLTDSESHRPFGDYWESLNPLNRWGGDWDGDGIHDGNDNDGNHYEMKGEA